MNEFKSKLSNESFSYSFTNGLFIAGPKAVIVEKSILKKEIIGFSSSKTKKLFAHLCASCSSVTITKSAMQ